MSEILSEVIKSRPVDRTARNVTSRGTHYTPNLPESEVRSEVPLPSEINDHVRWMVGKRYGSLTVIGAVPLRDIKGRDKEVRLVVRCVCGYYVRRTQRSLLLSDGDNLGCFLCLRSEYRRSPKKTVPIHTLQAPAMKPVISGENFTGFRFGKFVVLGLLDRVKKCTSTGAAWVVRCDCGYHEVRTIRALRRGLGNCCDACDQERKAAIA